MTTSLSYRVVVALVGVLGLTAWRLGRACRTPKEGSPMTSVSTVRITGVGVELPPTSSPRRGRGARRLRERFGLEPAGSST